MSKVPRLPLGRIIAATMLMTLVSTVAAAPSAGAGASTRALTEHDEGACDVFLEGTTAAELEGSLMLALEAVEGEVVLDTAQLEALATELALVAAAGGHGMPRP